MKLSCLCPLFVVALLTFTCTDNLLARNLVVCIDGTGNHPDDATEPGNDTTNVLRFSKALLEDDQQSVKYFPGVATSGWTLIDAKGEFSGFGARRLRDNAYDHLSENYTEGDVGATAARYASCSP